jgi:putative salt-induced outer membrane protein YdiY
MPRLVFNPLRALYLWSWPPFGRPVALRPLGSRCPAPPAATIMTPTTAALATLAVHLGTMQPAATPAPAPAPAPADPSVPKGTVEAAPATTGATEIAGQGKFAAAQVDARHAEDATELDLAAGGLLSTGNAFAAAVTGLGRLRVRRGLHQVGSQVAGNYGRADVATVNDQGVTSSERETTVSNVQGMLRYDVFFARRWSAFAMATVRRDRFQGLDMRLNLDPGVALHVLSDARHRLWLEAGYDFQYDVRRDEAIVDAAGERIADKTLVNHAARVFFGYNNSLSDRITFDTGLEYLQSVIVGRRFRVNWVNALAIQLAGRFGLAVTFTLRYENQPLPAVEKLDTITAVLLTMRFI